MSSRRTQRSCDSRWVGPSPATNQPVMRLFCLPYAGGNAGVFRNWPARLLPEADIRPLRLPGRGGRSRDALLYRVDQIADQVAEALVPLLDRPYALFGHSMGACVAFEVARRLRSQGWPEPACLLVSGRGAPHLPVTRPSLHTLPDDAFIEAVKRLNGTPPEVLQDPELIEMLLPILRADFEAIETYRMEPRPPLACRIVALGGSDDHDVHPEAVASWRAHTTGSFCCEILPGDHFFLHGSAEGLFAIVNRELRTCVGEPARLMSGIRVPFARP